LLSRRTFRVLNRSLELGRLTLRVHRVEVVLHGSKRRRAVRVEVEVVNGESTTVVFRGCDRFSCPVTGARARSPNRRQRGMSPSFSGHGGAPP
jgi:hypothetical protein